MKRYGESKKANVLTDLQKGMSIKAAIAKYRLARSTIYLWKQESRPATEEVISRREVYDMRKEIAKLRAENEILRTAGCSENSPIELRRQAFIRLCHDYPLNRLCRVLNLTRGEGHYLRDHRVEETVFEIRDQVLKPQILQAFDESMGTYGERRIHATLQKNNLQVSEKKVSQLMHELGLVSKHQEYHWIRNAPRCHYYPNKLQRQFYPKTPNAVWTADLTYIRVGHEWRYFFAVIDLCKRRIIGWGISDNKTSEFVSAVLKRAFFERDNPIGLLYHTDQGTENTEFLQREWLRSHGVIRSYSESGNPLDNAVSESFFATFKKEFVRKRIFASDEILYEEIGQHINFYNDVRIHSSIGMMAPAEAEQKLLEPCSRTLD